MTVIIHRFDGKLRKFKNVLSIFAYDKEHNSVEIYHLYNNEKTLMIQSDVIKLEVII